MWEASILLDERGRTHFENDVFVLIPIKNSGAFKKLRATHGMLHKVLLHGRSPQRSVSVVVVCGSFVWLFFHASGKIGT
jgi:hypothetical protein